MHRLLINNLFRLSNIKNNPYDLLGLPNSATEEDIKSAYYKLAKQYHPDLKPEYSDKFKEINEAYNILKDPIKVLLFQLRELIMIICSTYLKTSRM
jgi:curved DNA-binding protein CbpA